MLTLFAAALVPLVPVAIDDPRLDSDRTFVSDKAKNALADEMSADVLCIDDAPSRYDSICLTREEWAKAIALANAGKGKEPPRFVNRIQHLQN